MAEPPIRTAGRAPTSEAAVIDVGSNSVRLVIFKVDGRAVTPILNEKVMAGLGRGLSESGMLNATGRDAAFAALKRFSSLVAARGVTAVHAVATAAVRNAKDGPAFVERVGKQCGVDLRVIEGREEARLSALGVLAGAPDACGVVGDLGGSSLEQPGPNAELGARYLKGLLERWQGNPLLAVASYNAGPGAVEGWIDPRLQRQPELWVEAIPYPETRLYVKKVLGNHWSMVRPRPPACPTPAAAPVSQPIR
jgi:hypothetical protein